MAKVQLIIMAVLMFFLSASNFAAGGERTNVGIATLSAGIILLIALAVFEIKYGKRE